MVSSKNSDKLNLKSQIFQFNSNINLERYLNDTTLGLKGLSDFNDVYESMFKLNLDKIYVSNDPKIYSTKWFDELKNQYSSIHSKVLSDINKFKISCFSHNPYETLMWSHYAASHNGFAMGFRSSELLKGISIPGKNVIYSSKLPEFSVKEYETLKRDYIDNILKVILTKQLNWEYEQEYRIILENHKLPFVNFNPKSLKSIIIGFKNKESDRIEKLISEFNNRFNTVVKILYAWPSSESYQIVVGEKKYSLIQPPSYRLYNPEEKLVF